MAAKTATVKYASRTAVYGSNAYDLNRVRDYSDVQAVPEREPAKKPAVKPAAKPANKTVSRTAQKTQKHYGFSLFAATGFVVVAVLMVFVLLAHVKFNEVSNETVQLQAQLFCFER